MTTKMMMVSRKSMGATTSMKTNMAASTQKINLRTESNTRGINNSQINSLCRIPQIDVAHRKRIEEDQERTNTML